MKEVTISSKKAATHNKLRKASVVRTAQAKARMAMQVEKAICAKNTIDKSSEGYIKFKINNWNTLTIKILMSLPSKL